MILNGKESVEVGYTDLRESLLFISLQNSASLFLCF
jgi:hypothetical protein